MHDDGEGRQLGEREHRGRDRRDRDEGTRGRRSGGRAASPDGERAGGASAVPAGRAAKSGPQRLAMSEMFKESEARRARRSRSRRRRSTSSRSSERPRRSRRGKSPRRSRNPSMCTPDRRIFRSKGGRRPQEKGASLFGGPAEGRAVDGGTSECPPDWRPLAASPRTAASG